MVRALVAKASSPGFDPVDDQVFHTLFRSGWIKFL